ncbi:MAG: hypothetical protein ACRENZ_06255 [Thermodesulfobacteriota bacterium]
MSENKITLEDLESWWAAWIESNSILESAEKRNNLFLHRRRKGITWDEG